MENLLTDSSSLYLSLECDCVRWQIQVNGCSCGKYKFTEDGIYITIFNTIDKTHTIAKKALEIEEGQFAQHDEDYFCKTCVEILDKLPYTKWVDIEVCEGIIGECYQCGANLGELTWDGTLEELESIGSEKVIEVLSGMISSKWANNYAIKFAGELIYKLLGNDYDGYPNLATIARKDKD